jgi:Ni/Fe-hydrogenase subunit HybB-like protein
MLELIFGIGFAAILAWVVSRRSHLRLRVRLELLLGLLTLFVGAMYAIAKRIEGGLGAVTNLSDAVPWGLWITFDLCGVALAAGGFLIAATVHVLHLRRFEPILRPTVLTALIAYQLVAAVLVLDLGRPQRFWHPLIMWQPHSVMFEITLCLTLYTLVLAVEFLPAVLERLGRPQLAESLHRLAIPVVIAGVILSTLHQSSFGSLFLIIPQKLHPLWYTPALPVFFLISAACAGLAVVIIEARVYPALRLELGRACQWVLWGYLALKVVDLAWRGGFRDIAQPAWLGVSWLMEVVGGALLPAVWFGRAWRRRTTRGLTAASLLVVGGVELPRANISWFALIPSHGVVYIPTWMEVVITAALASAGVLAFVAIAQLIPVFPGADPAQNRSSRTC